MKMPIQSHETIPLSETLNFLHGVMKISIKYNFEHITEITRKITSALNRLKFHNLTSRSWGRRVLDNPIVCFSPTAGSLNSHKLLNPGEE